MKIKIFHIPTICMHFSSKSVPQIKSNLGLITRLREQFRRFVLKRHPFFQGEWHFPENPKIDGDTARVLKSGKILNHRGARARIRFFKK